MICTEPLSVKVSVSEVIEMLTDRERLLWATALLETINERGTIEVLRHIVNDPQWNYRPLL